jgi:PAT family beta-lactamase induction signal transducer AmpG
MPAQAGIHDFSTIAAMSLLGFSSGLPLVLTGFSFRMWLTTDNIPLTLIGVTASLSLPYTVKFLWAPLFDELRSPLARLGRRRGWLATIQIGLVVVIAALGLSEPRLDLEASFALVGAVAFLSASQDIVIDAWRIESFSPATQGVALAAYVWGYRIAMLVSGSGVIWLSTRIGWHDSYLLMAALAFTGLATTLFFIREPSVPALARTGGFAARFAASVTAPLAEFLGRRGVAAIIAFIILYRLGEALGGVMLAPYYTYLGYNRAEIALANGIPSLAATLAGASFGGYVVARLGVSRALIIGTVFQTCVLLLYPSLALFPGHPAMLVVTILVESFAETFAFAAFLTYLSLLCDRRFTASQYALLSSLSPLALHTVGSFSGILAAAMGFVPFFLMTTAAALPALAVMLYILRTTPPERLIHSANLGQT